MAAHRLPDALFAALARRSSAPLGRWLAPPHAQATSGHRRTTGHCASRYTCRPTTRIKQGGIVGARAGLLF
eukprot:937591-Prymnesium_polylepis.1